MDAQAVVNNYQIQTNMKLKDFTINALKIAGVTDAELTEIVNAPNTDEVVLNDDLIKKFNTGILTLDSAKANPNLKSHFNAQVYNGIDALVSRIVEENEIDSLSKFDIDSEKSTPKKIELLTKALKKSANGKNPANADEIKALNDQLLKLKNESELALKNKENEFENTLIQMQRTQYLSSKEYANIPNEQKEIGIKIANEFINTALTQKGAILVRDNGVLKLKSAKDPSLDYYENNKAVSYNEFADGVLAQNNLLKVQNQTTPAQQGATHTTKTTPAGTEVNTTVIERNKAQLEAMKGSQ